MRPLQVWLPLISNGLGHADVQRDATRAFNESLGELTVWLLPDLQNPTRWIGEVHGHLALPSERLDRIDVHHVCETGGVLGATRTRFPSKTVSGLLDKWLNLHVDTIRFFKPDAVEVFLPAVKEGEISGEGGQLSYVRQSITFNPVGVYPSTIIDHDKRLIGPTFKRHRHAATVSPDGEASRWREGDPTLFQLPCWPSPFRELFGIGGGFDPFFARKQMLEVIQLAKSDLPSARNKAYTAAAPFLSAGRTIRYLEWYLPVLSCHGEEAVLLRAESRGFKAHSVKDLLKIKDFNAHLLEEVPIRRVWGAIGLFWALLIQQLEDGRPVRSCELCGTPIQGRKGKRYCGPKDSADCYRQRKARDRRSARINHSNVDPC